jgi:hypothetical protein
MKAPLVAIVLLCQVGLFAAGAQQSPTAPAGAAHARVNPQMQRLFDVFLGTWSVTEKIEPSESIPNGGVGEGEELYRTGPGGVSFIEKIRLKEPTGEMSGLGVGWWDEKAQGFRALWCNRVC